MTILRPPKRQGVSVRIPSTSKGHKFPNDHSAVKFPSCDCKNYRLVTCNIHIRGARRSVASVLRELTSSARVVILCLMWRRWLNVKSRSREAKKPKIVFWRLFVNRCCDGINLWALSPVPPQNTTITGKSKGRSHVCRFTKDCLLESTSLAVKIFHAPNYQCQPLPSAFSSVG